MSFLRYREYKDSGVEWLGDVPEGWRSGRLRWLSRRYSGGTPDKKNLEYWEDGTIPWLNSGAVNDGLIKKPSTYITTDAFEKSSAKWIPEGALVMALAGQGKTKGMVAQLGLRTTCNQSMAAIVPNGGIAARFLFWWLVSNYQNIRNMAGGDLRDGLNLELLGNIPCPLPGPAEQTAIAAFLDRETAKIDALVAEQRRLIELLKEKRQAVISHAVTKGLNPDAPMKDSGIEWLGEVPAHWEAVAVKRLARNGKKTFTDGDWIESPYVTDDGVRLIQTGNIRIGYYNEQGFRYITEETFRDLNCTEVMPRDVLICRLDGPVGRACLAPDLGLRMITSVDNAILKCSDRVVPEYVVAILSSVPWLSWIDALCRVGGGFRLRVSRSQLGEILVPLPPFGEQIEIVDHLVSETQHFDTLTAEAQRAIDLLQERRTALISAAVTGQIDVRGLAGEVTA